MCVCVCVSVLELHIVIETTFDGTSHNTVDSAYLKKAMRVSMVMNGATLSRVPTQNNEVVPTITLVNKVSGVAACVRIMSLQDKDNFLSLVTKRVPIISKVEG